MKAMAQLSWPIDPAFCSPQAQTLLGSSSPLCLVIKTHTRLGSVYLMARDHCSQWSGNKHRSSSWDLVGLDLSQGWLLLQEGAMFCMSSCHGRRPSHLTMAHQTTWAFLSPNCSKCLIPGSQPLVWMHPGRMPPCRLWLSPTTCPCP